MNSQTIIFASDEDTYTSSVEGWRLVSFKLTPPSYRKNGVIVPGRDGSLDYSAALTGGCQYNDRPLTIELDTLEGDVDARQEMIDDAMNRLNGQRFRILLPERRGHYLSGRVQVKAASNDLAVATMSITALCDPWRYLDAPTTVTRDDLTPNYRTLTLPNERRRVVPTITVTEDTTLLWQGSTYTLSAGTHRILDIRLEPGDNVVKAKVSNSDTGSITVTYQEASL